MVGNAFSRRPSGRQSAAVVVVLVVVGALTASLALQANPSVPPTPSPSRTASPTQAQAADWAALDLPPLSVPATLEPSGGDDAGLPTDTSFTLTSLTGEPAAELAARLEVSPEAPFDVASADATSATLTPTTLLAAGTSYRFTLRAPDGTVSASWAFPVRGPINVLSTIPGNATVGVPQTTGIEVTFDQPGVADMADHFTIEPAVSGTFERHGRTQVFVPRSLAPATTYTVTVRAGLARTGTDLVLPNDVVFRFETGTVVDPEPYVVFGREVLETGPTEQLDVALHAIRPWVESGQLPAPTSVDARVYRLPTLEAASDALQAFLGEPRWTQFSEPLMDTAGLDVIAEFDAPLQALQNDVMLLRLPVPSDAGWYIVEIDGERRAQAFLQVTPVSAWVSVMDDRTVVWVNDVTTRAPLPEATVAVASGQVFATTNDDGLAIGTTPQALLPEAAGGDVTAGPPILRVTSTNGDVLLVPFDVGVGTTAYRGEWWETFGAADASYWALLHTDRGLYRRTDRIEAWGYLRARDDGDVPATVQVRLIGTGDLGGGTVVPIASVDVRPGPDGVFTASLPISGQPFGGYQVQAVVDGRVILSRWVEVSVIRKPAYEVELTADHTAVITGTSVNVTATAQFFDGTPVASLPLEITTDGENPGNRVETDAAGAASVAVPTKVVSNEQARWQGSYVRPVGPEGAEIWVSTTTIVFPSAYQIDAEGVLDGSNLRVTGRLSEVDLARVERELLTGWDGDASGAPVIGRPLEVTVTELVPIRRVVGQSYDFIEKVVRPTYEYVYQRRGVTTRTIESAAGGRFVVTVPVPDADHQYEITLVAVDPEQRVQVRTAWVSPSAPVEQGTGVAFQSDNGEAPGELAYDVGEMVSWRMVEDGAASPTGGSNRFLFLIAQRGLRAAVVTDSPRFRHRFAASDAPGIFVIGVRFTGTTYAPKAGDWANFDTSDQRIQVRITADQPRYRPGDTASLSVRTTAPDGAPVAATVVLQAVDEKLYAIGGAFVPDPLRELYERVDSGIVRLTATHQVPTMAGPEGEGGDTTGGGGGDRADFRDSLLFRELRTGADGRASTTVTLSDDLTSWRVVASAVTADRSAGAGELLLPVGLPFFVELTLADTYLVADRPVLQVRAFGDALRTGDPIEFSVTSSSLGMPETVVSGTAFTPIRVPLPALSIGSHAITARGVATTRRDDAGKPLTDGLARPFEVVGSRLSAVEASYGTLDEGLPAAPAGAEMSHWTFSDAGRGRLIPLLTNLAYGSSVRVDRAIAQLGAHELLASEFGRTSATLPPVGFDPASYRLGYEHDEAGEVIRAGLALVPNGGVDPWLAARVAVTAPDAFSREQLADTLLQVQDLPTAKRDLQIAALAGLAALGEPVLGDLLEARRQPELTTTELIYLALGFAAVGDDATAASIERDLLARHGERLGAWVRLRTGPTDDNADGTALLAVVAAGVGDPVAAGLADYAQAFPAEDTANALELAAYARRILDRLPAVATSFRYSVDGTRSTVDLEPGEAFSLRLTSAQAATLSVEPGLGMVGIAVEARVPVEATRLVPHADLRLTRATLEQPISSDRIIEVNLVATFADTAPDGCYDVVEHVPSGLAPIAAWWARGIDTPQEILWPSSVQGQEVRFCAWTDDERGPTANLRYLARVVNEGTFNWEPAVMQFPGAPELLAITPATTATIGD